MAEVLDATLTPGKVDLVGWQGPEALRALYAKSSLFVMPSRKEAFCIAALEARAAGLPVVANAGTGIADFIRHDDTGLLTDSDGAMAQVLEPCGGSARDGATGR